MGDHNLYDYDKTINNNLNKCSSSSLGYNTNINPPSSSDEISLFLHQILHSSSSSSAITSSSAPSSTSFTMAHCRGPYSQSFPSAAENSQPFFNPQGISAVDLVNTSASAFLSGNVRVSGSNLSSSSLGVSENETTDDNDGESEEGVEEGPARPAPRSSSKRSRAAEVHNLSEKRRRSRINEKMKALQNLIPNSNKTDKASMLDEAIEYLKQLQLQVQMLTMRNGLSLHPMCLPGVLQPIQLSSMRTGHDEENAKLHVNSAGTISMNQENATQTMFSLPNQCAPSNQSYVPNMPNIVNPGTGFGLHSSVHSHFRPIHLGSSSDEETCKEDVLTHHQLNVNYSQRDPSEFGVGATSTGLLPMDTQTSVLKDDGLLEEACIIGRQQLAEGESLKNIMLRNPIQSPRSACIHTGRSIHSDDTKINRNEF